MGNPDPIFELMNTAIPEKLWHYTSIKGFHGILTSKNIRATDIRFLNDSHEFIHAHKLADRLVAETSEKDTDGFAVREILKCAVDLTFDVGLHPALLQVFVACFSAKEDQLSQWRGYSHGSSGISLAFDASAFRLQSRSDTLVWFAPCVYDASKQRELIRSALRHFTDALRGEALALKDQVKGFPSSPDTESLRIAALKSFFEEQNAENFSSRLSTALRRTALDLLRLAALLKDPSFREENEWRLVLPASTIQEHRQNLTCFRPGETTLIPYIEHPFPLTTDSALPLADVILGPGSYVNSVSATQSFLQSQGILLKPRQSKVPYRHSSR